MMRVRLVPTESQCFVAIALHLYRHPEQLPHVAATLHLDSLRGITRDVADLIAEYPALSRAFAGDLISLAEGIASDKVLRALAWLDTMPDEAAAELPSLDDALQMIAPKRARLEPLGLVQRWRSNVSQGKDGQQVDKSSTWTLDYLWRAACLEAAALEYERQQLYCAADETMDSAAGTFKAGFRPLEIAS